MDLSAVNEFYQIIIGALIGTGLVGAVILYVINTEQDL